MKRIGIFSFYFLVISIFILFYLLNGIEEEIRELSDKDENGWDASNLLEISSLKYSENEGKNKWGKNELLISIVFSPNSSIINLEFFIRHGLHDAADFIFVDNGGTMEEKIQFPTHKSNIFYWKRENKCYDIGTHPLAIDYMKEKHGRTYKKFIMMNNSVRGPFMTEWSTECWSDIFADGIDEKVKLFGTTYNCMILGFQHVQSMVMATDELGLEIMRPRMKCFEDRLSAVCEGEVHLTKLILNARFKVALTAANSYKKNYFRLCTSSDYLYPGKYYGGVPQPHEMIFIKTNRNLDNSTIDRFTEMMRKSGYSSYNICKRKKNRVLKEPERHFSGPKPVLDDVNYCYNMLAPASYWNSTKKDEKTP
eukprot:TRINITY_DN6660_c0_g1_i1.p1 TRINITY_DN6660_c0_g1~~TRINITY_DN6660_c0_g1_i1.p1  ORF type:complete len:366 (+),score=84.45 TRINITY_DN6660_c0_g1_i1:73-1170(+)